jgi:hypothetical protein
MMTMTLKVVQRSDARGTFRHRPRILFIISLGRPRQPNYVNS